LYTFQLATVQLYSSMSAARASNQNVRPPHTMPNTANFQKSGIWLCSSPHQFRKKKLASANGYATAKQGATVVSASLGSVNQSW